MARVLTLQRTAVAPIERARFLERVKARRAHYEQSGCHYWVFEEQQAPGAFVEFVEAADEKTLAAAIGAAPERHVDAGRIYREVEAR